MLGRHGGGWQVFTSGGEAVAQEYGRHPDPEHQDNFIACIKSRNAPNADVALAQRSHTVMHLGNISHRVGNRQLTFDGEKETFVGDDAGGSVATATERECLLGGWIGEIVIRLTESPNAAELRLTPRFLQRFRPKCALGRH